MQLFAAAFNTETNTFSPFPTAQRDFHVLRQADFERSPEAVQGLGCLTTWERLARRDGHRLTLGFSAHAEPSGRIVRRAWESLLAGLLAAVEAAGSPDVVLLDLHGAMAAEGCDDCEAEILQRLRDRLGPAAVIAVELDLHCHLSPAMVRLADLLVCYKEYPHDDINDRAAELYALAIETCQGLRRPTMAVFDCRMMGMYPTAAQPMRGFVDRMKALEGRDGVLSVSLVHGFPWGDVADAGVKVLVITDDNAPKAEALARELGLAFFALRGQVEFRSLPLEEALARATDAPRGPVVVADQSDNPGGGAPGDSTYALDWLLQRHRGTAAVAILYDPGVVALAMAAGEGARLAVRLGGKLGRQSGAPLDLVVTVLAVREDYHHRFPQRDGHDYVFSIGDTVALRCGTIDVLVSSLRGQCFSPCIFDDFALDARGYDLIVVKSTQHFYGGFAPLAAEVIYMAAPGAIPPLMQQIAYRRLRTDDKYPWNDDPHGSVVGQGGESV
jgi:microcystin degradation protein MlrC